jgi:hypothetical protein
MNPRTRTAFAFAPALLTLACDRAPERVGIWRDDLAVASSADAAPCTPETADKIGVPFVRVCVGASASFWISAIPIGCSAGEHGAVSCPHVTSLVQPPPESAAFRAPSPTMAAVVEAYTAHKICTMRFAGRLPTRGERAHARSAIGLRTVVVTQRTRGAFQLRELAEWVTEPPCAHPSDLGPECKENRFPIDSANAVAFPAIVRCAAAPLPALSGFAIDVGAECSVGDAPSKGGSFALPCAVRGVSGGPPPHVGFSLSCELPPTGEPEAAHPPARLDTAAFRCVLPEWV